ncbi:MAG: DUF721 domain-containing protein [Deltaproteobacteria bacterium]|nr:DUF721 domain-containing protein [Deltaproteobacteria bacterium]
MQKVHPAPDQMQMARVFGWWVRALPERIVRRARPVALRHGTLVVHCETSTWAQELSFQSTDFLARIRAFAPEAGVTTLRFRVGPLPEITTLRRRKKREPPEVAITELPADLGRALAGVADDELRQRIAAAATTSLTHPPRK